MQSRRHQPRGTGVQSKAAVPRTAGSLSMSMSTRTSLGLDPTGASSAGSKAARRTETGRCRDRQRGWTACSAAHWTPCRRSSSFKARKISLWLLDLGNNCSGNGISELIITVLAAVAQFERRLISERIKDAKGKLRRDGRHQGGTRPFGFQFGEIAGRGTAPTLIADASEQAAIKKIFAMRETGATLMVICDAVRAMGHRISHQSVSNILARGEAALSPMAPRHERSRRTLRDGQPLPGRQWPADDRLGRPAGRCPPRRSG